MTTKIRQIGNSQGVVISKKLLEEVGIKPGSEVTIEKVSHGKISITSKDIQNTTSTITPDFIEKVEKVKKEYNQALKSLASR